MTCVSTPMASRSASRFSSPRRATTSASCFSLSAFVSALVKRARGLACGSRCGFTSSAARGTPTCEWKSTVRLLGLISRPGRPGLRAVEASYLFHCAMFSSSPSGATCPDVGTRALLKTFHTGAGAVLILLGRATTNPAGTYQHTTAEDRHGTLAEKHVVPL